MTFTFLHSIYLKQKELSQFDDKFHLAILITDSHTTFVFILE